MGNKCTKGIKKQLKFPVSTNRASVHSARRKTLGVPCSPSVKLSLFSTGSHRILTKLRPCFTQLLQLISLWAHLLPHHQEHWVRNSYNANLHLGSKQQQHPWASAHGDAMSWRLIQLCSGTPVFTTAYPEVNPEREREVL